MGNLRQLAERMRKDWDRRVAHDYRFWMSDGHRNDAHMWETGKRDFNIIADGIPGGAGSVALEIGCGVGRMLPPARERFDRVIGFDISSCAIEKARSFVGSTEGIELIVGTGVDLSPVPSESVDFVWSFAAITSMPTQVIAGYLREIRRVLKPGGTVRLQMYLGEEMLVSESDTLHLRCYTFENLERALELAGFAVSGKFELILPIQVSFKDLGIEAFILSLSPIDETGASETEIAAALLPGGEPTSTSDLEPTDLEAWMAKNYAEQLLEAGEIDRARHALEYVHNVSRVSTIDTSDILSRIVSSSAKPGQAAPSEAKCSSDTSTFWSSNLEVARSCFPEAARILEGAANRGSAESKGIYIRNSQQGPSLFRGNTSLDHPDKPESAGDTWAQRSLQEERIQGANRLVVLGIGSGYHLEALIKRSTKEIFAVEPDVDVAVAAFKCRDLRSLLQSLRGLAIGSELPSDFASAGSELIVRPQALVTDAHFVSRAKSLFYSHRGLSLLTPRIAVLGPIQGGTQPIGQYSYNALLRLNQRVRGVDMSGFNPGFQLLDGFVNQQQRKNALHGMYVEMLSNVVFEAFNEKPIDILICMAQAPITPRILTELRKKGVITVLWFVEDYLRFTYWREIAPYYDFIFTIQKGECLDAIKKAGAGEVHYLPTACDPAFHVPLKVTQQDRERWGSPISFVGAGYHNRQQMFASLANMPFRIWGSEWPSCKPFDRMVQEGSRRIAPEEYIKIFNSTDINLNLHSSTERDGVDPFGDFLNPRTFELAACGAFQLVDERSLLGECFEVGREIITFRDLPDLREKIAYYMDRPEERAEIAQHARARVLRDHTYEKRLQEMLSVIYSSKFENLRARQQQSPWTKMLERAKEFPELHARCERAHVRGEEPVLDGLISDIVTGNGKLSETEQKLLFLFHVRKQIIRMSREETGQTN